MHVREMVEDVFDTCFFLFFYQLKDHQSAILDLMSKENDVRMYTIMYYLCAKYE